ncbi:MAG: RNA polymerase subunit sigma-70 [Planctomycetes bacterium]|nr:RNA polymerase subunit sigma-70 [Planctomycetota bacterium]MBL7037523.1 RNA polymerase subunit sigma-70 [Pirellulaceae bacterium]
MTAEGSVTHWLTLAKAGDDAAVQALWERYFTQLVRVCHRKLGEHPRRAWDEEDVALSAFNSFVEGTRLGRFPRLDDRDDLWQVLIVVASRKAIDQHHHDLRQKRGGGRVHGESALIGAGTATEGGGIDQVVGHAPTPEFAVSVVDQYQRLLDRLPEKSLREIAVWKMEGYTNKEIGHRLGVVTRTVERKLRLIRRLWSDEAPT